MELKEIREIVKEIIFDIEKNKLNLTYRNYETFLAKIEMDKRRNFKILAKFDYQFKKQNLTLWCGKESVVCSDTLCMVTPGPIAGENGFAHSFGVGSSTSDRIAAREW